MKPPCFKNTNKNEYTLQIWSLHLPTEQVFGRRI